MNKTLEKICKEVDTSYANNSQLYKHLAQEASLEQIVRFMYWDGQQPEFQGFIKRWVKKTPDGLLPAMYKHIKEEEGHGTMFQEMMDYLFSITNIELTLDDDILITLNYTFSQSCVDEQSFGFFAGSFYATETMAGKRYGQLINGMARHGLSGEAIKFLHVHYDCETAHSIEVMDDLIKPGLRKGHFSLADVTDGVYDRLQRSEDFLKWYETEML